MKRFACSADFDKEVRDREENKKKKIREEQSQSTASSSPPSSPCSGSTDEKLTYRHEIEV